MRSLPMMWSRYKQAPGECWGGGGGELGETVMLLPSQQGPRGGGGADSCAVSADVNCSDGRHRAKRANEEMSG